MERSYHSRPPLTRGNCETLLMKLGSSAPWSERAAGVDVPVVEWVPPECDQPDELDTVEVEPEGSACSAGGKAPGPAFMMPSAAMAMRTSSSSPDSRPLGKLCAPSTLSAAE